jgi:hypothetical protein
MRRPLGRIDYPRAALANIRDYNPSGHYRSELHLSSTVQEQEKARQLCRRPLEAEKSLPVAAVCSAGGFTPQIIVNNPRCVLMHAKALPLGTYREKGTTDESEVCARCRSGVAE